MTKPANKISKKIFNDVDAVYSYILSSDEIKKLSNDIVMLLRVDYKNSEISCYFGYQDNLKIVLCY